MPSGFHRPHLRVAGATEDILLDNDDIRPLRLKDRTWTMWTYTAFWFSATGTVATWYSSSSPQAAGLSLWESLACGIGGHILLSTVLVLNGRAGAIYHVGYPILCRSSFGVYGAWWPVFNRATMAIVWNGVNAVQGAQCIYVMLHAIFPSIAQIPNIMGSGSALDSGGMICFFVFNIITAIFLYIPVPKMKNLVYIKLGVFTGCALAFMAWVLALSNGLGAVFNQGSKVQGVDKQWLIVKFLILSAAGSATFASNAADFQRYARKPNDVLFGNFVGYPMSTFVIPLIGNVVCAASQNIYGELVWNPLTLLDRLQSGSNYTAGNRAGCFFIALGFAYSAIFSSIFENSLPAGNDLAALFPQFISIRRGFYVCAVVSIAICPWLLLGSASVFINFLASYQIFLSSITGILLSHYYIIARGDLRMNDLYTKDKHAIYYYFHGWNYRAYIAYIVGIIPNFYGFLNNMGVGIVAPVAVVRMYYFAYPIGLFVAFFTYWALSALHQPAMIHPLKEWKEPKDYIREDDDVLEGRDVDVSIEEGREKSDGGSVGGISVGVGKF